MAPFTRSRVSQATRDNIAKSVDEYNQRIYEEQKQEALEKKEMKKAAKTLILLSKVPRKQSEHVTRRPVTRSQR